MNSAYSFVGPIRSTPNVRVMPGEVQGTAVMPVASPMSGKGQWIWAANSPDSTRFFQNIQCTAVPKSALIRVTAESSYRLYVNGTIVSRGPADVGRDYDMGPTGPWLYDVVDVRKFLKSGNNTIAAEVIAPAMVQSEGRLGMPGLWLEGDFDSIRFGTDATWMASPNADLSFENGKENEPVRGRGTLLTLAGLRAVNNWFDGVGPEWKPAVVMPDTARPLSQSEIPAPMEAVYPATGVERTFGGVSPDGTEFQSDGGYSVRFDRVLSAHIVLRVNGGEGAILCVMPNEKNEKGCNRAVRLKLGSGEQIFEIPFFDSFSVINLEAVGVKKPFQVEAVQAVFRSYPVTYRGQFECSDAKLNEIWKAGRWLTQLCMQTHHLDSPHHQEPISDPGDYLIESLNSYYTFGEAGLARQDLRKYAQIIRNRDSRVFHTSYALLWLQMLIAYWQHTGDEALVRELAPTAFSLVNTWETWRGPNGLVSNPPNFMFIDWVELEGFNLHHPPAVIGQGVLTAFYYRALHDADQIAALLGDTAFRSKLAERRASIHNAFNRELWSPAKGLYRDGKPGQSQTLVGQWLPADKPIETFSSQVNILACAYGLVPKAEGPPVLAKVMESGPAKCQPYFMHFAFDALEATGLYNAWATRQMRRWKLIPDTQSFYEMWDRGDLSHAWQCTPTYQMSARILGVTPAAPGYREIKIQPRVTDLAWAKGKVPTPYGDVKVSWRREAGDFQVDLTVPRGTIARLILPNGRQHRVTAGDHKYSGTDQ